MLQGTSHREQLHWRRDLQRLLASVLAPYPLDPDLSRPVIPVAPTAVMDQGSRLLYCLDSLYTFAVVVLQQ